MDLQMPWLISSEIRRLLALPYIYFYFRVRGVAWGKKWRIFGTPIIQRHAGSTIRLGDGLILRSWTSSNPVAPNHPVVLSTRSAGAVIITGDHCGLTGGAVIAAERVEIGHRLLAGGNCLLTDTDFHPVNPSLRRTNPKAGETRPVEIGDDVFLGANTMVLKGSKIGSGSVIGAGSVVAGEIPSRVVAAGNPASVIREIHDS